MKTLLTGLCVWLAASYGEPVRGASFYPVRLDDPQAVYLTADRFPVHADGVADDADALQQAIDQVAAEGQAGVLFVPEGRYRLGRTVYVWPGVRLIGFGPNRPVFLLGENTPGFQEGEGQYMVFFSGGRGRGGEGPPRDGGAGTFYSALSNIDFEIRDGNPAAVGIRFHVAQHCYLAHVDFHLGSAKAGLEDIGNEVEDLRFHGGRYGITTRRSAPGWPILVMDCSFEGQSLAAIRCAEAGLAVVRPQFRNVPTAIEIAAGQPDQLYVNDAVLQNIKGPAFVISHENNARTQVNLEGLLCQGVPVLAQLRESGELIHGRGPSYVVERFSRGLHLGGADVGREIKTTWVARVARPLPGAVPSDIPQLPPGESWVNVKRLGVIGDGEHDDTAALREAIAQHSALYLPLGVYRVSDTLQLRPDSVLVGLNPSATVIHLPDETPAFQEASSPRSVIETPRGGSNILSGIGVYTGAFNPAAVAVKWRAGTNSLVNDVRLHGGHGTRLPGGIGDSWGRANRDRWDTQYPSLWVTDGGGGVFKDIWTPSPYAKAGLLISDTSTPGRLYALSAEHHVSHEVIIRNAAHWRFYALQFEEEREEGPKALPLLIENSRDLQFANTFFYRVRRISQRPEQLAFDRAGNLLVVAYEGPGTVLAFDPRDPGSEIKTLKAQPARTRPGTTPVLPVNRWMSIGGFQQDSIERKPHHYVSPDGTTFIPAGTGFTSGAVSWGVKLADLLRAFGVAPAALGERFYVSNEAELRTWSFRVEPDGSLADPRLFVEEGGEGVAVDGEGRVYVAAGQIRVFSPAGERVGEVNVPQRPTGLVFGGSDRKTLFITARSALYSVRIR